MAQTAENVFRDFVTDGVPASGANKPAKAAIRELLTGYETAINSFTAGGGVIFTTVAAMTLTYAANTMAWVIGDATVANNGVYQKQGASGSGSWTRVADLPYSFIKASNAGAGTANAIVATSSIPIPSADGAALITVNATTANTGAVTISFNGGTALSIVSSSGNALQAGYLTAGMQLAGFKVGSDFRLMTDIASAAIQAAAEAAANRAEAAAASAVAQARFKTVSNLLSDTTVIGYAGSGAAFEVAIGDVIEAGGFRYEVAASDATDEHVATAGGVKLYVVPDQSGDVSPDQFGATGYVETLTDFQALLTAGTYVDAYAELQKAADFLFTRGGGIIRLDRFYVSNTPLVLPHQVGIVGNGRGSSGIFKDSTTTKTVTYYGSAAAAMVEIYPGSLPTDANAVIILGNSYLSGRWSGVLLDFAYGSTFATPTDYESQKTEFGLLSIGTMSDFIIDNLGAWQVEYATLLPTPFVGRITNNRTSLCLAGFGIGNATTLTMFGNYANSARDYGYAFRASKYSSIFGNACDSLNRADYYPDRTRECTAYVLNSLIGCNVFNNGQEGTLGNHWRLVALRYCDVSFNQSIRVGSDYVGTADIAVWKIEGALVGCNVVGNNGYDANTSGLTFGGANPAKHHNIFQTAGTTINSTTIHNNVVRAAFSGLDTEAGWGNNNVNESLVVKRGGVYARSEPNTTYGNVLQGTGTGSTTFALGVQNSAGTLLLGVRDDGNIRAQTIYDSSSGASPNVVVSSTGYLTRGTSALKYKNVLGPLPDDMIDKVLAIAGFIYSARDGDPDRHYVGLAADHFHEAGLPEFVDYGANGEVEGLYYDRIVAVLLEAHRRLDGRISALEQRLSPSA